MATEDRQRTDGSLSAGPSGSVGVWHYYAAVGNTEAKLATLVELLLALQSSTRRSLAICCSSRDSLDSLVYSLLRSRAFAVTAIHSDLTDKERELALAAFKRGPGSGGTAATHGSSGLAAPESPGAGAGRQRPSPFPAEAEGPGRDTAAPGPAGPGPGSGLAPQAQAQAHDDERLVRVLVITDVCLKALPKELLPLGVCLLVEFDLPPSKEVYSRRLSAVFGGGKDRRSARCVVVDMVEAGAIGAFRALESFTAGPVAEMPVRVGDMLLGGA
ncbi:hypothetical protein PLESTB_001499000 [Pleodorina starrii]|uniref:Helicase C-terminal domain-containing protein n=1 Tax=Pleodorina starrii TaxID=330485 RepID=A0A9W6BW18_9CHLO|nr:hypothetical protein PLESTB_001499000 [Pleodorina starrii]